MAILPSVILPLEIILLLSFTCVYIAIIAKILLVMLWRVVSAPVLILVVALNLSWQGTGRKAVCTAGAGPVCECMG